MSRLRGIGLRWPTRLHAAVHELRCVQCRVTWLSWAQRILGMERGYRP